MPKSVFIETNFHAACVLLLKKRRNGIVGKEIFRRVKKELSHIPFFLQTSKPTETMSCQISIGSQQTKILGEAWTCSSSF